MIWNEPRFRALFWQVVVVVLLALLFYDLAVNTINNMAQRGQSLGFGFLDQESGFSLIFTLIDYSETSTMTRVFVVSLLNTILLSVIGIFFATILGFLIGIMRLSPNWVVNRIALAYVELFRNIPLLLQILFWYIAVLSPLPGPRQLFEAGSEIYLGLTNRGLQIPDFIAQEGLGLTYVSIGLGIVGAIVLSVLMRRRKMQTGKEFPVFLSTLGLIIGLPLLVFLALDTPIQLEPATMGRFQPQGGIVIIPELIALIIALSVYTASFIAEIVRAGIQSVPVGQFEASMGLGLKRGRFLQLIIIPQAMRVIIPPLTSQYLNLTKNSSLAAAIAYPELVAVFAGTTLNQTGHAVEIMAITMGVYFSLSMVTSFAMNYYNTRTASWDGAVIRARGQRIGLVNWLKRKKLQQV